MSGVRIPSPAPNKTMLPQLTPDFLKETLKGKNADYLEFHFEETISARIQYRGRDLEETATTTTFGGNIRALVAGGWGFISFNDLKDFPSKIELAIRQARLVGKEKSLFAEVEPVFYIEEGENPLSLPLNKKREILEEYNEIIWTTPKIQTSIISYTDKWRRTIFANSEGSYIEQRKGDITLRILVVARDGGEVQQAILSEGSPGDFSQIRGLHLKVKETAQRAVELLSASEVKGGEYTVVLDPILAGIFTHEAFGHLSESDFLYENPHLQEVMVLGRRFGGKHLNIVDDASISGLRGSYKYDDEGVPASKTYLIREGILVGRLHSRETAAKMKEKPTGNARTVSFRFPPIVRMSNTFIEPGDATFEDIISEIEEGIYAKNWYGGTTAMEMFTFSCGEVYKIRKGKIAELLRPTVLTGNVFTTLENIDAIGKDLTFNQGGGCGKGAQYPLPVSNGSPHIRLRRCLVGGR